MSIEKVEGGNCGALQHSSQLCIRGGVSWLAQNLESLNYTLYTVCLSSTINIIYKRILSIILMSCSTGKKDLNST